MLVDQGRVGGDLFDQALHCSRRLEFDDRGAVAVECEQVADDSAALDGQREFVGYEQGGVTSTKGRQFAACAVGLGHEERLQALLGCGASVVAVDAMLSEESLEVGGETIQVCDAALASLGAIGAQADHRDAGGAGAEVDLSEVPPSDLREGLFSLARPVDGSL